MNCRVVVEAAVPVYDVETADEAVRIAISKTGEMLNPDLNYVEINMGERSCPHCGDDLEPAFIAADESLVALELEMTVFNVEREEHAARIARKEIGQRLTNIPLDVLEIEVLETEDEEEEDDSDAEMDADETDTDGTAETEETADDESTEDDSAASGTDDTEIPDEPVTAEEAGTPDESARLDDGDEVLPEFEELIDE